MPNRDEVIDRLRSLIDDEIEEKIIFSSEGISKGFKAYITLRKVSTYNPTFRCKNKKYTFESKLVCCERDNFRNETFVKDKIIACNQFGDGYSAIMNLADLLEQFKKDVISGKYTIGDNDEVSKNISQEVKQCAQKLMDKVYAQTPR